jgi:oligoribonuclease NrnB/cAMP/cGMP phosphodiesterase (DHH superfamily)
MFFHNFSYLYIYAVADAETSTLGALREIVYLPSQNIQLSRELKNMIKTTTTATAKGRILSITHEQDVDGLFCGAILKNAFPDTFIFLTNYGRENMKRTADVIKFNVSRSSKSGTIVISDLALNNNNLEDIKPIEEAAYQSKTNGWNLVWLDHHSWQEEIKRRVESFATLILSEDRQQKCASELVVENFGLKKRTACERMAKFAHIVDFRLLEISNLPPLPEIITFYRSLPDSYKKLQLIIKKASKGIFWDEELQQEYEEKYLPLKESAMSSAMKSLSIHHIHGLIVAITESPRILSKSLLGERIFQEKPDVTVVVLYSQDGKVSIRRRAGTDIRCDLIAYRLNGGGHSYAAAGVIKSNEEEATTTILTMPRVVQELQNALKDMLSIRF